MKNEPKNANIESGEVEEKGKKVANKIGKDKRESEGGNILPGGWILLHPEGVFGTFKKI